MTTLTELDIETCTRLLAEHHVGRIAVNDPHGPVVLPVNYLWERGTILVRTDVGTKLAAAEEEVVVSFLIDHVDEERRVGWSVLVRGLLDEVIDPDELDRLDEVLPMPFHQGDGKRHVVRVSPRAITGRVIPLSTEVASGWYRAAVLGSEAFQE